MDTSLSIMSFEDDSFVDENQEELSSAAVAAMELELLAVSLESDYKDIAFSSARLNLTVEGVQAIQAKQEVAVASMESDEDELTIDAADRREMEVLIKGIGAEAEIDMEADDKSFMKTVQDMLKKALEKIKAFFKMIGQMIMNFVNKILNFFSGVEAKFKRLEKAATAAQDDYNKALKDAKSDVKKTVEKKYAEMKLGKIKVAKVYVSSDRVNKAYFTAAMGVVEGSTDLAKASKELEEGRNSAIEAGVKAIDNAAGKDSNDDVSAEATLGQTAIKTETDKIVATLTTVNSVMDKKEFTSLGIASVPMEGKGAKKKPQELKETEVTGASIANLGTFAKDLSKPTKALTQAQKDMKASAKAAAANDKSMGKFQKALDKAAGKLSKDPATAKGAMKLTAVSSSLAAGVLSSSVTGAMVAANNRVVSIYSKDLAGVVAKAIPQVQKLTRELQAGKDKK